MSKSIFILLPGLFVLWSCQKNFDNHLKREAREYTQKHCPKNIAAGHTLDSLTYDVTTRNLIRWYTFSGDLDTPIARETTLCNMNQIRTHLLSELRGDTSWETCKDENITFTNSYHSASLKKEIFRVSFTPEEYRR